MTQKQPTYQSYLLRLWQVRHNGKLIWRASLQSTRTGERRNFADLQQMLGFLRDTLQPQRISRQKSKRTGAKKK
jgi:hypothetical protein